MDERHGQMCHGWSLIARYPPRFICTNVPFIFVSWSPTDVMERLSKERGQAGFSDKAWGTPRENDHNGRHELHDVNAPPTARRAGLNLILIKSNKSADEWFLPGPGPVRSYSRRSFPFLPPSPRPRAPWARFCRIKSDSIFFWLRHERNAIKARSERALGETRLLYACARRFWLMTRWKKDWPRHGTRVLISFSFAVVVYLQALIKSPAPPLSLSLSSPSVFTFSPYFVLTLTLCFLLRQWPLVRPRKQAKFLWIRARI